MNQFLAKLNIIIASLWVGGMWSMFMVTTVLFNKIPSAYIAGKLAGDMFQFLNYFGFGAGLFILFIQFKAVGIGFLKSSVLWVILVMLILIMINYFGIQPIIEAIKVEALPKEVMESVFADRFSTWHGIASIGYLIQCLLGLVLLIKIR
jgi:hypothetical protein